MFNYFTCFSSKICCFCMSFSFKKCLLLFPKKMLIDISCFATNVFKYKMANHLESLHLQWEIPLFTGSYFNNTCLFTLASNINVQKKVAFTTPEHRENYIVIRVRILMNDHSNAKSVIIKEKLNFNSTGTYRYSIQLIPNSSRDIKMLFLSEKSSTFLKKFLGWSFLKKSEKKS